MAKLLNSNYKLKPKFMLVGLSAALALLLTGCSQKEQIKDINEVLSGSQVSSFASEYCDSPNKMPNPNLWYYHTSVYRSERGNQEKFEVVALQYDGLDYSCSGSWEDIPKDKKNLENKVSPSPSNTPEALPTVEELLDGCYLTDSSGFNDGTLYPEGPIDPNNPKSSICVGDNIWKVWSEDANGYIEVEGGTPGGAPTPTSYKDPSSQLAMIRNKQLQNNQRAAKINQSKMYARQAKNFA